jgi:hypothetical protein
MDGEAKAPLEPVLHPLHPSMLLGHVVRSPDLLESTLKLEASVFLKMLVFFELVFLLLVDGGQRHLLPGKFQRSGFVDYRCFFAQSIEICKEFDILPFSFLTSET